MVSASHNPFADNGLKVLDRDGTQARRGRRGRDRGWPSTELPRRRHDPATVGRGSAPSNSGGRARLVRRPRSSPRRAARGSTGCISSSTAPTARRAASRQRCFADLGATVTAIGDEPDGCNINDKVGSTAPQALADAVVAAGADLGIAVDGDADRCIAVDASGRVLDGDWLLALFATDRFAAGTLAGGVVVTVMSNLGLHHTLRGAGIEVVEVPVGDRHVADALARTGWTLGGEQSGHVVFADRAATGDGMLTGLLLAQLVAARGPLDELADGLLHARAAGARERQGRRRRRARRRRRPVGRRGRRPARARRPGARPGARVRDRAAGPAHGGGRGRGGAAPHRGRRCARACSTPSGPRRTPGSLRHVRHHRRGRRRGRPRDPARGAGAARVPRLRLGGRGDPAADGALWRCRAADGTGPSAALTERCAAAPAGTTTGIGHTRWATHGPPHRVQRASPGGLRRRRSRSSTTASWRTTPRSPSACARPGTST